MNAFSLDLPDKTFDLSFHKGFWSYFESDDDIAMLFREQLRVTKQYLIILVHNASNTRMVADFGKKAVNDDLYNVRFFQPNKLKEHLERQLSTLSVSATLRLRKFGGLDRIYRLPCQPCLLGLRDVLLANTYRFLPWSWAESIAVEVKLDGGT